MGGENGGGVTTTTTTTARTITRRETKTVAAFPGRFPLDFNHFPRLFLYYFIFFLGAVKVKAKCMIENSKTIKECGKN